MRVSLVACKASLSLEWIAFGSIRTKSRSLVVWCVHKVFEAGKVVLAAVGLNISSVNSL